MRHLQASYKWIWKRNERVLDLPEMYAPIKEKELQNFVGTVNKCKVVCFVWQKQGERRKE